MVGLSQDKGALDRLMPAMPLITRLVAQYFRIFPNYPLSVKRKEHHQLYKNMSVKMSENVKKY
jgi:hypothetical protein